MQVAIVEAPRLSKEIILIQITKCIIKAKKHIKKFIDKDEKEITDTTNI